MKKKRRRMSGEPACTVDEFRRKWGTKSASLLVEEFIRRCPGFKGDRELARSVGEVMGDLECLLRSRR